MIMTTYRRLLTTLLLASSLGLPAAAARLPAVGTAQPIQLAQQGDAVSLEEAAARVRAQTGGRILAAETRGRGADRVHRIKVLTGDNRVRIILVDPRTGNVR